MMTCDGPNDLLYRFDGIFKGNGEECEVGYSQFLLRGSVVKNTKWIVGLIVYTGHDTKIVRNSAKAQVKFSKVETLLNSLITGLICIMVGTALWFSFMGRNWAIMMTGKADYLQFSSSEGLREREKDAREFVQDVIQFGSWILVLPNFVPISLLITLDTVRYI
jgi:magnesium-transporting ATPase (P-type)